MSGFALWNLHIQVNNAISDRSAMARKKTDFRARKHLLFPLNVAGVVDEVEIMPRLGEGVDQICSKQEQKVKLTRTSGHDTRSIRAWAPSLRDPEI